FDVANSIMTGASFKGVRESQGAQCCVSTSAAAANHHFGGIDFAACREITRSIRAIVNVNHTPLTSQSLAIRATIAGTAAIINIENGDTAAGEVLNGQTQCGQSCRSGTAMAQNQQRRPLVRWTFKVSIPRPVKQTMRRKSTFCWELDRFGC